MSTINVNLTPCDCPSSDTYDQRHETACASAPVLVPLDLESFRSVTFEVRLGECRCLNKDRAADGLHADSCPARPVKVSCSITGKTWEESEVTDAKMPRSGGGTLFTALPGDLAPLRARWALVKALVMGMVCPDDADTRLLDLFIQRDAVFLALAKARRAEDALIEALGDYEEAMRGETVGIYGLKRESDGALARYVKSLIEQAGAVP